MSQTQDAQLSFGFCGRSGSGKTLGAASFGGAEYGKIIALNAEYGPDEGGGGLTTLKYASKIFPRITPDQVLKLDVTSWVDMQAQHKWLRAHAADLRKQGYRVLLLDSGTAMCFLIYKALTHINPQNLRGNTGKGGDEDSAKKNHKRELVTDMRELPTRAFEYDDYDLTYEKYLEMHSLLKQLPFTFITTFMEKDAYDENKKKTFAGIGPRLVGRQLPAQMPYEFDGFFHTEQDDKGKYIWRTRNDPTRMDSDSPHIAKHRFCKEINDIEPADGVALMKKLGVKFDLVEVAK